MQSVRADRVLPLPDKKLPRLMIDNRDDMIVMATQYLGGGMYQSIILDLGDYTGAFCVGEEFSISQNYASDYAGSLTLTND